jgi:glycolate oxidase FAD binding subunit
LKSEISNPRSEAQLLEPASEAELARLLARANADGVAVVPRGGGTKMDWGNPPEKADLVLSTRKLDRVLEHAAGDMTATVEAGCTIAKLQETLARQGQRLAVDPLWPDRATVGGVLATNDNGSLRHAFGSLRDLIIGITIALPDGTLARSGGKVVKNVAGYDLPKLMVGAFGTLGVVTRATFRLHPLPRATRSFGFNVTWDGVDGFVHALRESPLAVTGLQVLALPGMAVGVDVRVEGRPDGVAASAETIATLADACRATPIVRRRDPMTSEREDQWLNPGPVAKVAFPPAAIGDLCRAVRDVSGMLVADAVGAGLVVLPTSTDADVRRLAGAVTALGGTFVLLRGDAALKRTVNTAAMADALPLMRRVKQQFDPLGTLNPGVMTEGI